MAGYKATVGNMKIPKYKAPTFGNAQAAVNKISAGKDMTVQQILAAGLDLAIGIDSYNKQQDTEELGSAMQIAANSLNPKQGGLDYTQIDIEFEMDGETVNLFDIKREAAVDAINKLEEFKGDSYLYKKHGDSIDIALESYNALLALNDTMGGVRENHIKQLTSLQENYAKVVKDDPLLTDPGSFDSAQDIMADISYSLNYIENQAGKKIMTPLQQNVAETKRGFELLQGLHKIDIDKEIAGLQLDLENKYSPIAEDILEATELVEGESYLTDSGITATHILLPKDVEAITTDQYADAMSALGVYQTNMLADELRNMANIEIASDLTPLEQAKDYMEVGSPIENAIGLALGYQLFSDKGLLTDPEGGTVTFENNPYMKSINTGTPDGAILKANATAQYHKLKDLHDSGKYVQPFKELQTSYNAMLRAQKRGEGLTMDDLSDNLSSKIRSRATNLNSTLSTYNNQFKNKSPQRINPVPTFAEGTTGATTHESKSYHITAMESILKEGDRVEWTAGNAPSGEEPLLGVFKNATGTGKWIAMSQLVAKYLDNNGNPQHPGLAERVWDADEWFGNDKKLLRKNVFFDILKGWQILAIADPYGTNSPEEILGR